MEDYYQLLKVRPEASAEELRKAYRQAAKAEHPDLHPNDSEEERRQRQLRFVRITQAYETLSNPQKRAAYDQKRRTAQGQQTHQKTRARSSSSDRTARPRTSEPFREYRPPRRDDIPSPEQALDELFEELGSFFKEVRKVPDPLSLLVESAKQVFQEVNDWLTSLEQEPSRPRPRNAFHSFQEDVEQELERLKRQQQQRPPRPRSARSEVDAELERLKREHQR